LLGLIILLGVLTTMLGVAVVLVIVAVPIGAVLAYLIPLTDALLIGLGVLLLAGRNPFARLSSVRVPLVANPFGRAYLYGLLLGPLALPCAGAFALALIAYSVGLVDAAQKVVVFLVYGSGFGLPLVALSVLAGARQQQIVRFVTRHHRSIDVVAGCLLIAVGVGDFLLNLDDIRRTLGV
jgi:cytochrome c biogenesis protein CcdA